MICFWYMTEAELPSMQGSENTKDGSVLRRNVAPQRNYLLAAILQIVLPASIVFTAYSALRNPSTHTVFLSQDFSLWFAAEFITIFGIISLSVLYMSDKRRSTFLKVLGCSVAFLLFLGVVIGQWIAVTYMAAMLILSFFRVFETPEQAWQTVAARSIIFMLTLPTFFFFAVALSIFGVTAESIPEIPNDMYLSLNWLIEYYSLIVLFEVWSLGRQFLRFK